MTYGSSQLHGISMTASVGIVFLAALVTAIATGLGALPFLFIKQMSRRWLGVSNGIAAGLMLGASHALITEGSAIHASWTVAGLVIGALLVAVSSCLLQVRSDLHVGELRGAGASKAALIVAVMTLHSMAEGIGVGVSFGGDEKLATFVTGAIAIHNIPEGLAISLVLIPQGVRVWKSAAWSIFSSMPQPLFAVPAFMFVAAFEPVLPFGLGFAAGAMIWVAVGELLSDAFKDAPHSNVATSVVLGLVAMMTFQILVKS
ncbi:zinc transporter ZupT [Nitrobacter vulgaris]|uniref:ZIP family metal transporter n=1 Tax=Nitrobacter vulgaris TaxID=29421 RepID=UPI00285C01BA|nr:ZIP family metal transporter [Nitrobacter vulgaris]MDR6305191.1 zinc transporter ZupT [Nitrobacter vulgaris]